VSYEVVRATSDAADDAPAPVDDRSDVVVPLLRGLKVGSASRIAGAVGLGIQPEGDPRGVVVVQEPAAGTTVASGDVLRVVLA